MGLKLFSDGPIRVPVPNPNPHRFRIVIANQVGDLCVCRVHYPDCTTYGGDKVLVYRADAEHIIRRKKLDPHFLETGFSPIARFPATSEGWADALAFAEIKSNRPGVEAR